MTSRIGFLGALAGFGLIGCLDFDQFVAEGTTTSTASVGGAGGMGGTGGSSVTTNVGGAGGAGGEGGSPWQLPPTSPCFPGDEVSDDFSGPSLPWLTKYGIADYSTGQAVVLGSTLVELDRSVHAGVLADCHFQITFAKADVGVVFMQLVSVANEASEAFTFRVRDGGPAVEIAPGPSTLPLLDASPLTSGVVRFGNFGGEFFFATAPSQAGPWTLRYRTSSAPAWLSGNALLRIGIAAPLAADSAIFDDLNLP